MAQELDKQHTSGSISRDLPLNFHPAAIRVSAEVTPVGAV